MAQDAVLEMQDNIMSGIMIHSTLSYLLTRH